MIYSRYFMKYSRSKSSKSCNMMDDETLNRLAAEALLEEAKLGAKRAEIMGPSGWIKPKECINKRFLHSTLRNVVLSNKYQVRKKSEKQFHKSENTLN